MTMIMAPSTAKSLTELVDEARANDATAWNEIVHRLGGLVWSITRSYGVPRDDALDVSQTVWLQLARRLDRIIDPERLGLWLATTTRRECMRYLQHNRARVPVVAERLDERASLATSTEETILQAERQRLLWRAVEQLPEACRSLVRLMLSDPEPSYAEISEALGIPLNSIGPRRQRCLGSLKLRAGQL
jgi:RNA polymerase sigma factor (sigma-70 family)